MDTNKDETTFMTDSEINDTMFASSESQAIAGEDDDCTSIQDECTSTLMILENDNQSETLVNDDENVNCGIDNKKSPNMGIRAGILIGGITSLFVNFEGDESTSDNKAGSANTPESIIQKDEILDPAFADNVMAAKEETAHPAWADDKLPISKTVNDDMSFSEAFAAARAELGIGASFEWRGKIYGTYTADEWDNLTAENRSEFANHFVWDNINSEASDVAEYSDAVYNDASESVVTTADDDIEIISVQHPASADESDNVADVDIPQDSDEVEVTAVKFDYSESPDVDVIGITSTNEEADIQNEDIVVPPTDNDNIIPDGLDRLTTPPGDLYALNDASDI